MFCNVLNNEQCHRNSEKEINLFFYFFLRKKNTFLDQKQQTLWETAQPAVNSWHLDLDFEGVKP